MRLVSTRVASALVVGLLLAAAPDAIAADTPRSPPDILLLIDTSGSMARTTFRESPTVWARPWCGSWTTPKTINMQATAAFDPNGAWTAPDRWTMLIKVLTGTVKGIACVSQARSEITFKQEFRLGLDPNTGEDPIDARNGGYHIPYNRIIARENGVACTPAPSWSNTVRQKLVDNALAWPTDDGGPIIWRKADPYSYPQTDSMLCPFAPQEEDGLIDQNREAARFGLMTFDTQEYWQDGAVQKVGIGIVPSTKAANYIPGVNDTWSFFDNWLSDVNLIPSSSGTYHLPGCGPDGSTSLWEIGARNPAAPPWEGRLITFGSPTANASEIAANNEKVQQALLSVRPFGDTPVAAMLDDARAFLLKDTNNLPPYIGGKVDTAFIPKVTDPPSGCRQRAVVLLTDGGPTSELRPDCQLAGGKCPYPTPQDTAEILKNNNIKTYVIGFSLANGATTCKTLLTDPNACSATNLPACDQNCPSAKCAFGYCLPSADKEQLATCCVMKNVANKGGTEPLFAESEDELRSAFTSIVSNEKGVTESRTTPVFVSGSGKLGAGGVAGAEFLSSYEPHALDLYDGKLTRERYECTTSGGTLDAVRQAKDANQGDDLSQLVNTADIGGRRIFTVVGKTEGGTGKIYSERSIRPWYNNSGLKDDGLGKYDVDGSSDANTKLVGGLASTFVGQVPGLALLSAAESCTTSCCFTTPTQTAPSADDCRDRYLKLELGMSSGNPDITYKRSKVFGAINKSTPLYVPPPNDLLRDDSYAAFERAFASRPPVLYAATVDGQLHAFRTDKKDTSRSELWAFIPPAVLPQIEKQFGSRYYGSNQFLLDGPVIVRNVPGKVFPVSDGRFLSRTKDDSTKPDQVRWYSILVGSFGSAGGYYALDVSWPDPTTDAPVLGYAKGPRFLWQLTTDADGLPLFGDRSGTPSIATLYFKAPGDVLPAEHAVAILPGGVSGQPTTTSEDVLYNTDSVDSRVTPRARTRKWLPLNSTDSGVRSFNGARSLTIVRLDTGEVIRTLRFSSANSPTDPLEKLAPPGLYAKDRITGAKFHSPISGRIIAYPAQVGSVSDRAYVGDTEGRLWRLDMSSVDPAEWSAAMFFDAYPSSGMQLDGQYDAFSGQPIQTHPVLSVDTFGRVTIAFATGDQNPDYAEGKHIVWSLTEKVDVKLNTFASYANWYLNGLNAKNPPEAPSDPENPGDASATQTRMQTGERVFGPVILFNQNLYFTTYDPGSLDKEKCIAGGNYLWGVHYINAGKEAGTVPTGNPEDGPMPAYDLIGLNTPKDFVRFKVLPRGSIPFGAGLSQKPACYDTSTTTSESFLGFGVHSSISSMSAAVYQLVVQGGKPGASGQTNVTRINLPPPSTSLLIDSWASIVE